MNLRNVQIIGFFSLPDRSLQESNPEAYASAMRDIPWDLGAGSCSHCGMAICHHVVILDEAGKKRVIGTSCAEKVGADPEALRSRKTSEEMAIINAKHEAKRAEWKKEADDLKAKQEARKIEFADVLKALEEKNSDFHRSLAEQLIDRALSWKQAEFVCKAIFGRANKKNADAWEAMAERVQK